jgi:iron complex transport system substrate-binding protein
MSRLLHTLFALVALLLAVVPAPAGPDTPASPTLRLITAAPNLTEMIDAMGLAPQLVAVSRFCTPPATAPADLPRVVDLSSVDTEVILRLAPTHIITLPSNAHQFDLPRRRGAHVHTVGRTETLDEIDATFLAVAAVLGREPEARAYLAARPPAPVLATGATRPRVLFVLGSGQGLTQLYAVGRGTYLDELLTAAGADNVLPASLGIYPTLNKEALLALRPDIILAVSSPDRAAGTLRDLRRDWAPLSALPAVRRGDYRIFADQSLMVPGPRARTFIPLLHQLLIQGSPGEILPAP